LRFFLSRDPLLTPGHEGPHTSFPMTRPISPPLFTRPFEQYTLLFIWRFPVDDRPMSHVLPLSRASLPSTPNLQLSIHPPRISDPPFKTHSYEFSVVHLDFSLSVFLLANPSSSNLLYTVFLLRKIIGIYVTRIKVLFVVLCFLISVPRCSRSTFGLPENVSEYVTSD